MAMISKDSTIQNLEPSSISKRESQRQRNRETDTGKETQKENLRDLFSSQGVRNPTSVLNSPAENANSIHLLPSLMHPTKTMCG